MSKELFIALSTFAQHGEEPLSILMKSGFHYSINPLGRRLTSDEVVEMGQGSEGIIAGVEPYTKQVLANLPLLRCISRCGVGTDNIDRESADAGNIAILNTPDVVIQPMAELVLAMILDLLRKLSLHTALLKTRQWVKKDGYLLKGKTVGIIGLGRIGKKVAELLLKLEATVYGADIMPDHNWANTQGVRIIPLEQLLQISDIISLHISNDKDNSFLLSENELKRMKKGALLINSARGQFIEETALYNALKENHLGGAALDVFPFEPYHGSLCELDNIVLTPHVGTLTVESRLQMEVEATNNLVHYLKTH